MKVPGVRFCTVSAEANEVATFLAEGLSLPERKNGHDPAGPMDNHGERIYYLNAPEGLPLSFQSKLV